MLLTTSRVLIITLFCLLFTAEAFTDDRDTILADYAVVIRDTVMKASLDTYAEIIQEVEPKAFFPILNVVEDKYGIIWAQVDLGDEKSGYLTDVVLVRKTAEELKGFLGLVDIEEFSSWDQEEIDLIQSQEVETGLSVTKLMFAEGLPENENRKGGYIELVYPRNRFLINDGKVVAITRQQKLLNERSVVMEVTTEDPEFKATGGEWGKARENDKPFATDSSGKGTARYRIKVQITGEYKFFTTWISAFGNSPRVKYRISSKGQVIGYFTANHRLHKGKVVELGSLKLGKDVPIAIEVSTEDGLPFSAGTLLIRFVND